MGLEAGGTKALGCRDSSRSVPQSWLCCTWMLPRPPAGPCQALPGPTAPMGLLLILLLLQVTAASSFTQEIGNAGSRRALRGKGAQRTKRAWIISTIAVQEEDKGPFPKYAGQLGSKKAFNASQKYFLSGPGVDEPPEAGLFSIEGDASVYVHRSIDREKTPAFLIRFNIENRESGKMLDHPFLVKIKVQDINDNAPEFSKEEYSITVRENHSQDQPVFQVTALDRDEVGTVNSQVSYSITMQTPIPDGFPFKIDPTTGSILLSRCLDYKTANSFKLLIKASDHGSPQLSSTATVNVAVEDANNHLPVFASANYQLQVSAGQEHPAVLRLQVEDKDSPSTAAWRAKYRVGKGNEREQFSIKADPHTNEGILSIIKPLPYEGDSEMRLVIAVANEEPFFLCKNGVVMSSSLESSTTTVNIKVIQSQRAPEFHPPLLIVQKEDSMKPGKVFRKYPATYPDDVPNKIKYELAHDPGSWLRVDENSGVLTVAKEFEKESPFVNNSLYTIIVQATGHGFPPQTATGTILLYLSDINDHMPSLVAPSVDVCDKKEGTLLIIQAKPALVYSHSGPLTFELAEDSEDEKHNWTLGRNFGQSVELLMLRSLPQGSYLVPIIIQDTQGFSARQKQHIRLCFCPDGHTCEESPVPQAAVGLGGGATAIVLMAFLLLLVSSILLCRCYGAGCKGKAIVPPQEGEQTLISYNEESRNPCPEAKLDIAHRAAPTPVFVETGKEVIVEITVKNVLANDFYLTYCKSMGRIYECYMTNCLFTGYEIFQARHLDYLTQRLDTILAQKLDYQTTLEDSRDVDEPCRYFEEGELEHNDSLSSVSTGSEDLPVDFWNTLGPSFSALEEICQKGSPSLN